MFVENVFWSVQAVKKQKRATGWYSVCSWFKDFVCRLFKKNSAFAGLFVVETVCLRQTLVAPIFLFFKSTGKTKGNHLVSSWKLCLTRGPAFWLNAEALQSWNGQFPLENKAVDVKKKKKEKAFHFLLNLKGSASEWFVYFYYHIDVYILLLWWQSRPKVREEREAHGKTMTNQRDPEDGRGLGQLPLLIFLKLLISLTKQSWQGNSGWGSQASIVMSIKSTCINLTL